MADVGLHLSLVQSGCGGGLGFLLRGNRGKQAQTEGCEDGKAHRLIVTWLLVVGGRLVAAGGWWLVAGGRWLVATAKSCKSAKGAARTTKPARNIFAPRSVLREFLKSAKGAARTAGPARNIFAPHSVLRELLSRVAQKGVRCVCARGFFSNLAKRSQQTQCWARRNIQVQNTGVGRALDGDRRVSGWRGSDERGGDAVIGGHRIRVTLGLLSFGVGRTAAIVKGCFATTLIEAQLLAHCRRRGAGTVTLCRNRT